MENKKKKNKNKGFSEPPAKSEPDMNPPESAKKKPFSTALEAALASVEKMGKKHH